jgi:Zn finger protein HypA/HybF involved in hydrogenase expression
MGYLRPVYSRFDPFHMVWEHAYQEHEFEKIRQGYACGQCGEDFEGEKHEVCPVCRSPRMGVRDNDVPEWMN